MRHQSHAPYSFLASERSSGLLAAISSLPGHYGIGDIGSSSLTFIDFLRAAGQKYWQILPTVPTSLFFDSSPYMSTSAFAGSPLLISPVSLYELGLIEKRDLAHGAKFSSYLTHYHRVDEFKKHLLKISHRAFSGATDRHFSQFVSRTPWLNDYALFMSLKEVYRNSSWSEWPEDLARREPSALAEAEERYSERIEYYCLEQYLFFRQWSELRKYARQHEIRIIGDIPIYVALDSCDVWANQHIFEIDQKTLKPTKVSGVPPDYFSKTGQLWGNPLYRWDSSSKRVEQSLLEWWVQRFRSVLEMVDVVRVDHFRGFQDYWAVPASETTAVNGSWLPGPGASFFEKIYTKLGALPIIAEDLGEISAEVIKLRDTLGFPGMKVLQFAFDGNPQNPFLPYNYATPNCVVYTGTHDNDTTLGWFLSDQLTEPLREEIKKFANRTQHDASPIHLDLIYLALSSVASLAIIPLQDLLGFGSDCRMNIPGVAEGNWQWRCSEEFLTDEVAKYLKTLTSRFGRA